MCARSRAVRAERRDDAAGGEETEADAQVTLQAAGGALAIRRGLSRWARRGRVPGGAGRRPAGACQLPSAGRCRRLAAERGVRPTRPARRPARRAAAAARRGVRARAGRRSGGGGRPAVISRDHPHPAGPPPSPPGARTVRGERAAAHWRAARLAAAPARSRAAEALVRTAAVRAGRPARAPPSLERVNQRRHLPLAPARVRTRAQRAHRHPPAVHRDPAVAPGRGQLV